MERSKDTVVFSFNITEVYDVICDSVSKSCDSVWLVLDSNVRLQTCLNGKTAFANYTGSIGHIKDKNYTRVEEIPLDNFVIHMIGNLKPDSLKNKSVEIHYFYDNSLQVFLICRDDITFKLFFDIEDM